MTLYGAEYDWHNAAQAVIDNGLIVLSGTKTPAIRYANKVIECVQQTTDMQLFVGYKNVPYNGYFYFLYDADRFSPRNEIVVDYLLRVDGENSLEPS